MWTFSAAAVSVWFFSVNSQHFITVLSFSCCSSMPDAFTLISFFVSALFELLRGLTLLHFLFSISHYPFLKSLQPSPINPVVIVIFSSGVCFFPFFFYPIMKITSRVSASFRRNHLIFKRLRLLTLLSSWLKRTRFKIKKGFSVLPAERHQEIECHRGKVLCG